MTILVADDDPGVCSMLSRILRYAGHAVFTATTGTAFLELMVREEVDLALLDAHLGDMNALDLLAHAQIQEMRVPIVVISGLADGQVAEGFLRAGAARVIEKPFDVGVIRSVVQDYMERLKPSG
jgi:DNA-binding response OmpR family regulator